MSQSNLILFLLGGRGDFAIDGPGVSGLVLNWLVTTNGTGGYSSFWTTTSSSGMIISGNPELNGTYGTTSTHNGESGSWVQVHGAITYITVNGYTVAVTDGSAICRWMASRVDNGYYGNDMSFTSSNWWNAANGVNSLIGQAAGSSFKVVGAASSEAQVMKILGITSTAAKKLGIIGNLINIGVSFNNAYNHFGSDDSGFYTSKFIGSIVIAGTTLIPVIGPILSITLTAIDASGGFDGIYEYTGGPIFQYQMGMYANGYGWRY